MDEAGDLLVLEGLGLVGAEGDDDGELVLAMGIGVEDLVGAGLDGPDPLQCDVFLDDGGEVLDLVLEVGSGPVEVLGKGIGSHLVAGRDEIRVPGHEVGFAGDLDEGDLPVVGLDEDAALVGGAAGALLDARHAPLAEELLGAGEVAVRLDQGLLAVHHARAGLLAQVLYIVCLDIHRVLLVAALRPAWSGARLEPGRTGASQWLTWTRRACPRRREGQGPLPSSPRSLPSLRACSSRCRFRPRTLRPRERRRS